MEKKMQFYTAAILFLIAAGTMWLVLQSNRNNSFEIQKSGGDNEGTDITEDKTEEDSNKAGQKEEEAPVSDDSGRQEADWTRALEKYKGKEISKVNTQEKKIALTFDAGANADGVDKILSILQENNIKGNFFLTGKFIEKYPDKAKAIIANGGDIGNHTYDHPYLTKMNAEQIKDEIKKTEDALGKIDGKFKPFLRSPYGDRNQSTLATISDAGYVNIRWTVDSLGWKGTSGGMNKASVEQKVIKGAAPGAIMLMHLGSNPDDKTQLDSEALPDIIAELRKSGYEFATLSELLELEK